MIENESMIILALSIACCLFAICLAMLSKLSRKLKKENEETLAKVDFLTYHNPVTKLPNRKWFLNELEKSIATAKEDNTRLGMFFIDLDNFKTINDAHGHSVGDLVIRTMAERIKTYFENNDSLVAHLAGNEFAVLLNHCTEGSKDLSETADGLLATIATPIMHETVEINLTASIGVSTFPDACCDTESLLKNCDTARYSAKKQGRNTYAFYTQDMNEKALQRTTMFNYLRKALEREELVLYYQPKVDIKTGYIMGSESLIRWIHPELGMVSPADFIPLAEESGLIMPIGDWIIKTACAQTALLQKEGFDLGVAVNLSAYQFNKGDVAAVIAETIWETGIEPAKLELELTESVVMGNAEKSLLMLRVLKSMGIRLAIDDFGTGYSSLSHLRRFPVDSLKIDQSFVKDMDIDEEKAAIVQTIVSMAKRLGLKTVAEGVEKQEELDLLRQEGADIMQGYFFSKPLPFDKFSDLVRENLGPTLKEKSQNNTTS